MNKPLQIGITGGIGTGKSFVCKIFKHLNIPVYDADSRAKWLMANNSKLKESIIKAFGEEAYTKEGLNRKYLASKVFNDSDNVSKLNSLVHPAVGKDYQQWVKDNQESPYLLKEAALMFESGSYKQLDKVIYVHAPKELRLKRIKQRDPHRSEQEIEAIIKKQLSAEEMKERSDYIINNDEKEMLLPQVIELHNKFKVQAQTP